VSATIAAVELFALSGGLGVIWFEPAWLQEVALWDPLTYMIHSLQQAVFYQTTSGWPKDAAMLAAAAAAAGLAGTLAMRRGLAR
jgi:ABC-type multidrug transport system permease subunit